MSDNSSGRDPQINAGSDSKEHYGPTAHEAFKRTPASPALTPTRTVGQSIVHDRPPGNSVAGSAVRDR